MYTSFQAFAVIVLLAAAPIITEINAQNPFNAIGNTLSAAESAVNSIAEDPSNLGNAISQAEAVSTVAIAEAEQV